MKLLVTTLYPVNSEMYLISLNGSSLGFMGQMLTEIGELYGRSWLG